VFFAVVRRIDVPADVSVVALLDGDVWVGNNQISSTCPVSLFLTKNQKAEPVSSM
jgi:hypothetical protein